MNRQHRSLFYGLTIGDGCIRHRTGQAVNGGGYPYVRDEYVFQMAHGDQQRAYCEHKAKLMTTALGGRNINVNPYMNGAGNRFRTWRWSKSSKLFRPVYEDFYPGDDGIKVYSEAVLSKLDAHAVALWYLDDGSARRNVNSKGFVTSVATDIATCRKTEAEAQLVADWFFDRFGITFNVRHRKGVGDWSLQCNTAMSRRFAAIVSPHVPKCMLYKLAHVADLRSHERQATVGRCCVCTTRIFDKRRKGLCGKCYTRQYRVASDS